MKILKTQPKTGFFPSFVPDKFDPNDYEFGGETKLKGEIILPNGDWQPFLQELELQFNRNFDSWSCTNFAFTHCLTAIKFAKYGLKDNLSERFNAVMSGTKPGVGNGIKNPAESARKDGMVKQESYPFTPDLNETEYFKYPPQIVLGEGIHWLEEHSPGYEWVQKDLFFSKKFDLDKAKEALKYSPLQTAVDFNSPIINGIIQPQIDGYNHSEFIFRIDTHIHTFNSYLNCHKIYSLNYPFFSPLKFDLTYLPKLLNTDMFNQLIRNSKTGEIAMIDSDGKRHWIPCPDLFIEFIGQKSWDKKEWIEIDESVYNSFVKGEDFAKPLSPTLLNVLKALKEALVKFGRG